MQKFLVIYNPALLLVILSCLFFSLSSCQNNYQNLRQDLYLQQHFNRDQIKDLAKLLEFFDEAVCHAVGRGPTGLLCYRKWEHELNTQPPDLEAPLLLSRTEQWEFSQNLLEETISSIWAINNPSVDGRYASLPVLQLKSSGPYTAWVESIAAELPELGTLHQAIQQNNINSKEVFQIVLEGVKSWPLSDPRHRLIIALHVLTERSRLQ